MELWQKSEILDMKNRGIGNTEISRKTGISVNTIKSFLRRRPDSVCEFCGKHVEQTKGRKHKRFCSDKCRYNWWNRHKDLMNHTVIHAFTCPVCGKKFNGEKNRKFCSHGCYIKSRFGGDDNDE